MPSQIAPSGVLALKQRAAQGDPQAQSMLQELMGTGTSPQPQGNLTNPQMPPQMPQGDMTQSQFGNQKVVPPDVAARRAQQLIKMLRERQ